MTVTSVEDVTKIKFKVFLDGQFAFVLYKGELTRYGIRVGEELDQTEYERIMKEVVGKRARLRAMHLLEDMDRTEAMLRTKLTQGLYPQQAIDGAIEYVKSFGYIDDLRYAKNFLSGRQGAKSSREIYAKLSQKGVSRELIDIAFEQCSNLDNEQDAIRTIIRKKRVNPEEATEQELHKLYGYLSRKGFHYEDIRQVIQNCRENT